MENFETLHQLLKKQTIELHEKGHQVPYIANLLKNNISLESYVGHLRAFAIIYSTLEHQLSIINHPAISEFLEHYTPKGPLIQADLAHFNAKQIKDIIPAVNSALNVADKILKYSVKSPYKLIGFLYTLDGSLNGGSVFKKHIAERFRLENGLGVHYFSSFDVQFKEYWKNFTYLLNTRITDPLIKEEVLSSATEIFNDLLTIYQNLYPIDEKQLGNHITALNPEAGNFPISTNPLEIQAAISAGIRCWNEFTFYEMRYGERGKRFASSDSVWLLTLSELPLNLAVKQVNWLANFLAKRGMPTITMEFQLKCLYEELVKAIPDNKLKYKTLLLASEQLKSERTMRVPSIIFENSNSIFQNFCLHLNIPDKPLTNTGILIASSIADQKSNMETSLQNFKSWLTQPALFSSQWILAVEQTYSEIYHQIESLK